MTLGRFGGSAPLIKQHAAGGGTPASEAMVSEAEDAQAPTQEGMPAGSGQVVPALRALIHDLVFSVTDADTVAWASGSLVLSDGTTYSISGGNTGNMAARTFVYFDRATSLTVLQTTTTLATAVGDDKVLIATAINGTDEPEFVVYGGIGGLNINGSVIVPGTIGSSSLNLADRGWIQTCAFSVTDLNTVEWAAGSFIAADGTTYSIGAGNTGNMAAATYVYLDIAVSTTAYQTTTTASTAVGAGKVMIAVAQNGTVEPTFTVFVSGVGGTNLNASSIVTGSITANEIATGAVTAGKISVTSLAAIVADLGAITAGTIVLPSGGFIRSGQTAYDTGTGFYIGNDSSVTKFSIGIAAGNKLTWDGTTFTITGVINAEAASDIGSDALNLIDDASFGRNYVRNGSFESWSGGTAAVPDGWTLTGAGATVARNTTNVQHDAASVNVVAALNTATDLAQSITVSSTLNTFFQGAAVTFSCKVKAGAASRVFLKIDDGVGTTSSSNHSGGGTFETLSVTRTLNGSATKVECSLEISSGASITATFDGAMLVLGSAAVEFSPTSVDLMLKPRVVTATGDYTMSEATAEVITTMEIANVILSGTQSVLLLFNCETNIDTADQQAAFQFFANNGAIGVDAPFTNPNATFKNAFTMMFYYTKPGAGSYDFDMRVRMADAARTITVSNRAMMLMVFEEI